MRALGIAISAFLISICTFHTASGALLVWSDFADAEEAAFVRTSNLDGSNVQVIASSTRGGGVAVDQATGRVYYADRSTIRSVNIDGTDDQLLADVDSYYIWNMQVYDGYLYFNSDDPGDPTPEQSVGRIDLDGTGLIRIGDTSGGEGLSIHEDSGQVYYSHYGLGSEPPNTIKTVAADGLSAPVALPNQPNLGFSSGLFIDNDADLFYMVHYLDGVYVANLDGSNLQFISDTLNDASYSIYVDSPNNTIYWGSRGVTSVIGRMDLDGSNQQILTATDNDFFALTVYNASSENVPEPASLLLLSLSGSVMLFRHRRRKRSRAPDTSSARS